MDNDKTDHLEKDVDTEELEAKATRGLVLINTGNGKGKTTAALGLMLRAWGHGKNVVMLQFIKNAKANFGEHRAARKIGLEIIPGGAGFAVPGLTDNIDESELLAENQWNLAKEKINSGTYDMVILDELSYPMNFGWIDENEVLYMLKHRPEGLHIVITGRDMPEKLVEYADLVTEMVAVKHPFEKGIKAQLGIEF